MASSDSRRFTDSRYPNSGSSNGRRISNADNYRSRGDGHWSVEASPRDGDISMSDAPPRRRDDRGYDNYRSGDREYDGYRSGDRRDDRRYDQRDDRELFPKRGESGAREDPRPGPKRDSIGSNVHQHSPAPPKNPPLVVATSSPSIPSQPTNSTATTPVLAPITIPPLSLVSAISAQAPQSRSSKLASQHDITGMISETAYIYWKFREAAQQYDRAEEDVRSREEHFKGFPLMQERYQLKIKTATYELEEAKKEWNLRQDNLERGMRNAVKLETERSIEGNLRKVEKYVREVLENHINSAASRTSAPTVAPAELEFLKREIQTLKQRQIMPVAAPSELKELRRELDQLKQKDEQREKQMQELTKQNEVRYGKFEVQAKMAQTTQNQIREELDAVKSALQELKKDIPGMQKQIGLNTETINEHKKLQSRVERLETDHRKTAETVTNINTTHKAIQNQQNQVVAQHDSTQKAIENIQKNQTLFIGRQDKIEEQSTALKKAGNAMAEKQETFNKQVLELKQKQENFDKQVLDLKQKQDQFDKRASQISTRIDNTPTPVVPAPIVTSSFDPSDLVPIITSLKDYIHKISDATVNGIEPRFAEITAQISSLNISQTDTATALSAFDEKVNNLFARLQAIHNHFNTLQAAINTLKAQSESLGMGLKHCDDKLAENSTKEFAEKIATMMQQRFPNWFETGKQIQYLLSSYRAHEAKLTQQLNTISQLLNDQNAARQIQSHLQNETAALKTLQTQLQTSHSLVVHKVKQLAAERAERQQIANTANDTNASAANAGNSIANINSAHGTPSPATPAPPGTLQLTNGTNETDAKISRLETEIQENITALSNLDETFNVFRTDMQVFNDGVYEKLEGCYQAIEHLESQQLAIVSWVERGLEGAPPIPRVENPEEPEEEVPTNNQNGEGSEEGEIMDEQMQGVISSNERSGQDAMGGD